MKKIKSDFLSEDFRYETQDNAEQMHKGLAFMTARLICSILLIHRRWRPSSITDIFELKNASQLNAFTHELRDWLDEEKKSIRKFNRERKANEKKKFLLNSRRLSRILYHCANALYTHVDQQNDGGKRNFNECLKCLRAAFRYAEINDNILESRMRIWWIYYINMVQVRNNMSDAIKGKLQQFEKLENIIRKSQEMVKASHSVWKRTQFIKSRRLWPWLLMTNLGVLIGAVAGYLLLSGISFSFMGPLSVLLLAVGVLLTTVGLAGLLFYWLPWRVGYSKYMFGMGYHNGLHMKDYRIFKRLNSILNRINSLDFPQKEPKTKTLGYYISTGLKAFFRVICYPIIKLRAIFHKRAIEKKHHIDNWILHPMIMEFSVKHFSNYIRAWLVEVRKAAIIDTALIKEVRKSVGRHRVQRLLDETDNFTDDDTSEKITAFKHNAIDKIVAVMKHAVIVQKIKDSDVRDVLKGATFQYINKSLIQQEKQLEQQAGRKHTLTTFKSPVFLAQHRANSRGPSDGANDSPSFLLR